MEKIVLRDGTKWLRVSAEIKRRGLAFMRAMSTREGVRFFHVYENDFRGITKMQMVIHTCQLPSEKLLNVVL